MNYELCKQLKDAGFPQDLKDFNDIWVSRDEGQTKINVYDREHKNLSKNELYFLPTLSELIEACGDKFQCLKIGYKNWIAGKYYDEDWDLPYGEGSTPEEAVAKLWLELNKK